MCYSCWEGAGKPRIDNEKTRALPALVEEVYEHNGVGGNLHVVLDDWNLDDHNLAFCEEQIAKGGYVSSDWPDEPHSTEQLAAEFLCLQALKAMTEEERYSGLALAQGMWDEEAR